MTISNFYTKNINMNFLGLSEKRWVIMIMMIIHSAIYKSGVMDNPSLHDQEFVIWMLISTIVMVVAMRQTK